MRKEDFLNPYLWDAIDNSAFNAAIKMDLISYEDLTAAGMQQIASAAIRKVAGYNERELTASISKGTIELCHYGYD